jgi:hypothetical protein
VLIGGKQVVRWFGALDQWFACFEPNSQKYVIRSILESRFLRQPTSLWDKVGRSCKSNRVFKPLPVVADRLAKNVH